MLSLPLDVQHMVVDYIHTLSDLKALCLTSQAFHSYVIPKLYERVDVRLWDARNLVQFENSIGAGAKPNFRHTRTLVFEDESLPPTLHMEDYHILEIPEDDGDELRDPLQEERLKKLASIVNVFPDHVLQRFCFVAQRQIPLAVLEHLQLRQRSLVCLQCMSAPGLYELFSNLRELDTCYFDTMHTRLLAHDLQRLHDYGKNLTRLHLTQEDMYEAHDSTIFAPTRPLRHLKQLSLTGMYLSYIEHRLFKLFDFFALTHLSLLGCQGDAALISNLGTQAHTANKKLRLQHISTYLGWREDDRCIFDLCFGDVFDASPDLRSLNLSWREELRHESRESLLSKICAIGPQLEVLSLAQKDEGSASQPLLDFEFRRICKACPNIRELGYGLGEETYFGDDCFDQYKDFMAAIEHLAHLETLHIHLPAFMSFGGSISGAGCNPSTLATQIQIVASRMFSDLHASHSCPNLHVLVIGHMGQWEPRDRDYGYGELPQFCYVKGEQKDALGRKRVVGVPVSRGLVRRMMPRTEIMDEDSVLNGWDAWAARVSR